MFQMKLSLKAFFISAFNCSCSESYNNDNITDITNNIGMQKASPVLLCFVTDESWLKKNLTKASL